MTHRPKDPAILSDPMVRAWHRGELSDGVMLTPQPMTDNDGVRERVARAIHAFLCRRDIMQYLDNDEDCAGLADAALSATPVEALQQRVERLEVAGRTLQGYIDGRPQDPFYERKNRPAEIDAALRIFRARAALGDDVG